jgi:hypothetical protein
MFNSPEDSAEEMRLPMVAGGEFKDADSEQDIPVPGASERSCSTAGVDIARPVVTGCIAMNA